MGCRCAPALIQLRNEVDARWPGRDKASDGCCGDAAHAARVSDHNPDAQGWAHAYDIDEDIAPGTDLMGLWDAWRAMPDPRIKYLIYESQIVYPNSQTDRRPRAYTGPNAHRHHLHVSIVASATHDVSSWLERLSPPPPLPATAPIPQEGSPMDFVGQLPTPEGDGCWILLADGAVHTGGNAQYFGGANQHMNPLDRAKEILPRAGGLYGYTILTVQSPVIGFTYPADGSSGVPKPPVNQQLGVDRALVAQVAALEQTLAIIRVQAAELVATAG